MIESERTATARSLDRDPATPEALWRDHGAELLRFGTVLVGPGDAHDTVIDAFLRASVKIEAGTVRDPRAHLFRSVVNTAADPAAGSEAPMAARSARCRTTDRSW